jgi:hypothetical protein
MTMKLSAWGARAWATAFLLASAAAVGCARTGGAIDGGGAGGGGGGAAATGGAGGAPPADAAGPEVAAGDAPKAAACPERPTALRTTGVVLSLPVELRLGGKPFVFGEPNAAPSGESILPLNFRFYVSHVALLPATGPAVPVDVVTPIGAVEPYGLHLFNADDPASQTLRVLAPAGTYVGISFTLGIDDACNSGTPAERTPPLTDSSQMTWPHAAGYLFLRYEARLGAGAASDAGAAMDVGAEVDADAATDAAPAMLPPFIHMGGVPGSVFAPTVKAPGPVAIVAGQSPTKTLILDVGAIYAGATTDIDVTAASLTGLLLFPEVLAGERLRQHAPGLSLFVLAP